MSSASSFPADAKVFLVTGANKGLGLKCIEQIVQSDSKHFSSDKDVILLASRSVESGNEAVKTLKQQYGDKAKNVKVIQLDVSDKSSIASAVKQITEEYGRLDRLIQNAGIARYTFAVNDTKEILATNLHGVIDLNDAILPLLKKSSDAKEIIVSSEVGAWCVHSIKDKDLRDKLENSNSLSDAQIRELGASYVSREEKKEKKETIDGDIWPTDLMTFYGGYGVSKALVSAYGRSLAARNQDWLTVGITTPGYCATDLNKNSGPRSAETGAKSILYGFDIPRSESGKGLLFDFESKPFVWTPVHP